MLSFLIESAALVCAGWVSGTSKYQGIAPVAASNIADWVLMAVSTLVLLVQLYRAFFVDRSPRMVRWMIVFLVTTMLGLAVSQLGGFASNSTAIAMLCMSTVACMMFVFIYLARDVSLMQTAPKTAPSSSATLTDERGAEGGDGSGALKSTD